LVNLQARSFFCSWSGGKDSCLALYRTLQKGGKPHSLLTVLEETGVRSRSHALPVSLLQRQAEALGIPLETCNATWQTYEETFKQELARLRSSGVEVGVFGDIDLDDHRTWEEMVCTTADIDPTFHYGKSPVKN
jgi:diphthamide synthase (EF-2-diphthine--ammonia ligase)